MSHGVELLHPVPVGVVPVHRGALEDGGGGGGGGGALQFVAVLQVPVIVTDVAGAVHDAAHM